MARDDPGLADRIRHAARVSQDSAPSVRINPRVVGGVVVPDRLEMERRRWRFTSESRYRVLGAWQGCRVDRLSMLWWLHVWWTREGLRCR